MPTISCIMPVYNTAKYLDEAIQSILNQTFTDFEFIISDDGSTDGSKEIIKKYAEKDSRIIFLDNPINRGICANLNDMTKISNGEYIAFMESDDISMPERFVIQYEILENNKQISMVGSWADIIDDNGRQISTWKTEIEDVNIKKKYLHYFQFCTPVIFFRKNLLLEIGAFSYSNIWDNYFYTNLILSNKIVANIPKILIKKRELTNGTLSKGYLKIYGSWMKMNVSLRLKKGIYYSWDYLWIIKTYIQAVIFYFLCIFGLGGIIRHIRCLFTK